MSESANDHVETLEDGHIYFLYRPRVEEHEPSGPDDLQQLYMVLSPTGKKSYRLAIIGREALPDPTREGHERYWGFVDAVTATPRELMDGLTEQTYQTKTRGTRHQPAARPAGEGVYALLRHDDHTHLAYALELPSDTGAVQTALNIADEASYVISVRNPEKGAPPRAQLPERQKADFPQRLMEVFHDRKFAEVDPPEFLDHEGAAFVMIAASESPEEELGIELDTDREDRASADIFNDLRLRKSEHPVEPLLKGDWA
jgi:hypothetical protein